jgi:hypothetical protein
MQNSIVPPSTHLRVWSAVQLEKDVGMLPLCTDADTKSSTSNCVVPELSPVGSDVKTTPCTANR